MLQLDHIGIDARDAQASAQYLAEILGIAAATLDGPNDEMFCLQISEHSSLLYSTAAVVAPQHIAFRVDEASFIRVIEQLQAQGVRFGNNPEGVVNGETSDPLGGKGRIYFHDPDGHLFEVAC